MFDKHKIDENRINYKDFLFDIRSFKFQPENIYVIDEKGERKRKAELMKAHEDKRKLAEEKFKPQEDSKLAILNVSKEPVNSCERIFYKGRKVGRIIKRYFPEKDDFE